MSLMLNIILSMILCVWFDYHILCVFPAVQIRKDADYDEAKIRWSNYKKESDAYQGALENKDYYTKKFMKLKPGNKDFSNYDFAKLAMVLDELIKACSKISSEIRKNEVDVQYPD